MYGGSNEVFGKNENFPLVLDIKLHLKIPVNYQLQISPPPTLGLVDRPTQLICISDIYLLIAQLN